MQEIKYDNQCVICYQTETEKKQDIIYSECKHQYCLECYRKISLCAVCRKLLNKTKLFNEFKLKNILFDSNSNPNSNNYYDLSSFISSYSNTNVNNHLIITCLSIQSIQDSIYSYLNSK